MTELRAMQHSCGGYYVAEVDDLGWHYEPGRCVVRSTDRCHDTPDDALAARQRAEAERAARRIASCSGHAAVSSRDECFTGPVSSDENRAAHGGITVFEVCRCGAERRTNVNGNHIEEGRWA